MVISPAVEQFRSLPPDEALDFLAREVVPKAYSPDWHTRKHLPPAVMQGIFIDQERIGLSQAEAIMEDPTDYMMHWLPGDKDAYGYVPTRQDTPEDIRLSHIATILGVIVSPDIILPVHLTIGLPSTFKRGLARFTSREAKATIARTSHLPLSPEAVVLEYDISVPQPELLKAA